MRKICAIAILAVSSWICAVGQTTTPPPPQSARQALIEMFLGKRADDFAKHLPEDARRALIHKGETPETSTILRFSTIGREMVAQGNHVETFDTGPAILVNEQNEGHEKIEVLVEHDSLMGEEDEIELSVHYYKNGEQQFLPVVPRVIFAFKQENEIWRLTEVTAAAHAPLTDPDYLQGLRKMQDESYEASAQMRVSTIAGAESEYAAKHPDKGYACTISSLFARDAGTAPGEIPQYMDPGQASDEWNGYRFTLSGCQGSPATRYRLLAVPADPDSTAKTFCADESGRVRFIEEGKPATCFSRGRTAAAGATPSFSID